MAKKMITKGLSLDAVADVLADVTKAAIAPLEKRITELESRSTLKWSGVHQPGVEYGECSLTTHAGGLWIATKATAATPGASADWRLIVKSGDRKG